jgi:hypothetical protein
VGKVIIIKKHHSVHLLKKDVKMSPFFDKYPLVGAKAKDYSDFKEVAELMKEGAHFTPSPPPVRGGDGVFFRFSTRFEKNKTNKIKNE